MSDHFFKRNLLALSRSDPSLGDRLMAVDPDSRLELRAARSGAAVPVLRLPEREAAFHSLVDPEREADRLVAAQPPGGFIVALGLGAGYALSRYLASTATTGLLVVEYSPSLLRALLEAIDLSELFIDERFSLILDPEPEELSARLLSIYVPPLAGDLRSLPLRGRVDLDKEKFERTADAVREVLKSISDDYSVQAFFGKLWLKNAARNLFASEGEGAPLPSIRRAAVAAAGPSLEDAMQPLARAKEEGAFLIATDTSLPALLGGGLRPDAVISIDCQHISYYHFLGGIPPRIPLVLDLSSPNRIARLGAPVRFFSSGHPFCAYISSRFRAFPALDTSGGNVTHAALSLAEALGSEETLLAGADFSYPEGKSYARGTYIYGYFGQRSGRLSPSEGLFSGFVYRNAMVSREEDRAEDGSTFFRYLTKPLMSYREHLERFAARSAMSILPIRSKGVAIATPKRPKPARRERRVFAPGPAAESARSFLESYAAGLRTLPLPRDPSLRYLGTLAPEERDLWTTLLPASSTLQREAGELRLAPAELLEATRCWALRTIEEALDLGKG
ncbi:MAG: 6-hydroxymethylpterin diphosphokinase MptE-like protein [Rectinemataceae bacterium]